MNSLDLEQEVDPLNVDHFSCTPLVRHTHTHMLLSGSVCMYVYMHSHTLADNVMMTQNVFVCSCVVVCVYSDVGVRSGSSGGRGVVVPLEQRGSGNP